MKKKIQGILLDMNKGNITFDDGEVELLNLFSVMTLPTANEIQKEAEKYQDTSVNKMAIERTAFGQGALWIKSLSETESGES